MCDLSNARLSMAALSGFLALAPCSGADEPTAPKPPRILCGNAAGPEVVRCVDGEPYAAQWLDSADLHTTGFGAVRFEAYDGNELEALVYRARGFEPAQGPLWFVMHGASRAAERYIRTAAPVAERHGALAIVIRFPESLYPGSSSYTLGVTTHGGVDGDAWSEGRWRDPEAYLYAELEYVFDAVRAVLGGRQDGYYLFGHSAGAQFTHRLLTFLPAPRVAAAAAANAGWYTLPVAGASPNHTMPYGLGGTDLDDEDMRPYLALPFSVLLGERDVATPVEDDLLRGTLEAMAQGTTRRARGNFYFETGRAQADALGAEFDWRLATVPRAGHDAAQTIQSAGYFLFEPGRSPCRADDAAAGGRLRMTEILADPPHVGGDANADGERDPIADEFVEISNAGDTPVCMAGWALGDAADPERHVFPLGPALAPGATLVVFGGGVPVGRFHDATVQTAAFGGRLSLTNEGDVLTLRDASDDVVTRVSWGDCGGGACAPAHWVGDLGIERSIVATGGQSWQPHAEIDGRVYSPGEVTTHQTRSP